MKSRAPWEGPGSTTTSTTCAWRKRTSSRRSSLKLTEFVPTNQRAPLVLLYEHMTHEPVCQSVCPFTYMPPPPHLTPSSSSSAPLFSRFACAGQTDALHVHVPTANNMLQCECVCVCVEQLIRENKCSCVFTLRHTDTSPAYHEGVCVSASLPWRRAEGDLFALA